MNPHGISRLMMAAAAAAAALFAVSHLSAFDMPPLTGRVSDHAGLMSPETRASLDARLADLERTDSTQVAVLTVPDLQGLTIEEFSMKVAEQWKIGRKKLDNGVILLVSRKERKTRIEVGYGLEGRLTDLLAGRILDYELKPSFKAGDYDRGFTKGVDAIIRAVRGEYAADGSPAYSAPMTDSLSPGKEGFMVISTILTFFIVMIFGFRGLVHGTIAGAVLLPLCFIYASFMNLAWAVWLILIGAGGGLLLSLFGRLTASGENSSGRNWSGSSRSSSYSSSSFSSSSGGSSDYSGGGGDFGGGGASSGW